MRPMIALPLLLCAGAVAGAAGAQAIAPGRWDVRSTAVDLTIPGAPGFLLKMARGKSRTEQKCIAPADAAQGVAALLVPDPKSNCTVTRQVVANGRIEQALSCPQKKGTPLTLVRTGSYDAAGFTARLVMTGETPKGAMRVVIDQVARRNAKACRG